MWLACWDGRDKAALLLLSKGADPNKAARYVKDDEDVITPLFMAAERGNTEVVRSLLASGARQDIDTGGGELC